MHFERPKCRRCGGPLDLWHELDTGISLICNNPSPLRTDEQFWERWNNLSGDEVAYLTRVIDGDKK